MKDIFYTLFNTSTNEYVDKPAVWLSKWEAQKLNYAYALNGSSLRYVQLL